MARPTSQAQGVLRAGTVRPSGANTALGAGSVAAAGGGGHGRQECRVGRLEPQLIGIVDGHGPLGALLGLGSGRVSVAATTCDPAVGGTAKTV